MDTFQSYANVIVTERQWSWTLVGIVYLAGYLFIRSLFFRPLIRETQELDPSLYSDVKAVYLKNSPAGWIVFSLSFLLLIVLWTGWRRVSAEGPVVLLFSLLLSLLFFLSVALHLMAFAKTLLAVLRQRTGIGKEL